MDNVPLGGIAVLVLEKDREKLLLAGTEIQVCARTESARAAACLLANNPHRTRKSLVLARMEISFQVQSGLTTKPRNVHCAYIWAY